jgi:hypothetical protein
MESNNQNNLKSSGQEYWQSGSPSIDFPFIV